MANPGSANAPTSPGTPTKACSRIPKPGTQHKHTDISPPTSSPGSPAPGTPNKPRRASNSTATRPPQPPHPTGLPPKAAPPTCIASRRMTAPSASSASSTSPAANPHAMARASSSSTSSARNPALSAPAAKPTHRAPCGHLPTQADHHQHAPHLPRSTSCASDDAMQPRSPLVAENEKLAASVSELTSRVEALTLENSTLREALAAAGRQPYSPNLSDQQQQQQLRVEQLEVQLASLLASSDGTQAPSTAGGASSPVTLPGTRTFALAEPQALSCELEQLRAKLQSREAELQASQAQVSELHRSLSDLGRNYRAEVPMILLGQVMADAQERRLCITLGGRCVGKELVREERLKPDPDGGEPEAEETQVWRATLPLLDACGLPTDERLTVLAKSKRFDPATCDDLAGELREAAVMTALAGLRRGADACAATGATDAAAASPLVVPLLRVYVRAVPEAECAAHGGLPYELVQLYKWLPQGDLQHSHVRRPMRKAGQRLELSEVRRVLLQLLDGFRQLHAVGFVWADGKLVNCGLDEQGNVALFDLGGGVQLPEGVDRVDGQATHTRYYASPEQLLPPSEAFLCRESDVYTWGSAAYLLLDSWLHMGGSEAAAQPLTSLIADCTAPDCAARPSAQQALERLMAWLPSQGQQQQEEAQ